MLAQMLRIKARRERVTRQRAERWKPLLMLMEMGFTSTEAQALSEFERDAVFEAARQIAELRKPPKNEGRTLEMVE